MTAETEIKIKALKAFCADQDKVLISLSRFERSQKPQKGKSATSTPLSAQNF